MIRYEFFEPLDLVYSNFGDQFILVSLVNILSYAFFWSLNLFSCYIEDTFSLFLGARFEFTLDEDLKVAAACDDVKDALAAKISRERIGTEVHSNSSITSV